MTHGILFNIQRFSIHDGPGIRTSVFFKGCNLRCWWCHNPEAHYREVEIQFFPEKCIACGACVEACSQGAQFLEGNARLYRRDLCRLCLRCTQECFSGALQATGRVFELPEVIEAIERDRIYYQLSGGGVTFSGGEPLLQHEFLKALLSECRQRGIHCAVDTAGNVDWEIFAQILPLTNLFLYDVKAFDEQIHRRFTGAGNRRILENLERLAQAGSEIWVRIPVVPGVNDAPQEIGLIADFLAPLKGIRWVELLPFHTLGSEKYASLGRQYPMQGVTPPSKETLAGLQAILESRGLPTRTMS